MEPINVKHKKEEKKIPNLRFPGFEGEWEKSTLKKEAYVNPKSPPLPEGFIYIDLESVTDGILTKEELIKIDNAPSRAQRLLSKEDILFQTVRPYQRNNLFFNKKGDYVASTGYAQIKAKSDPKYLYQFLYTTPFVNKVIRWSTGTSYPAISPSDLVKIPIAFPSLPEQQKIASFLSAVDQKIQQLTRKKKLLEQYKKGVMQKIFSQEIRFKPDNAGFDSAGFDSAQPAGESQEADQTGVVERSRNYPDWEEKRLGDYIEERVEFPDELLPLYSLTIEQGMIPKNKRYERSFLVKETNKAYKVMYQDDFAFNPMNLRFGALARLKENCIVSVSKYYNIFFCNKNGNPKYFEEYFTSYKMIHFYNKMAMGSLEEKKRVHYIDFLRFKLRFPCIEEQNKIASFLEIIDKKIEKATNQLDKTQQFKKGLLQQMFV